MSGWIVGKQKEFCGMCNIVLLEKYYRCPECTKLTCPECWSSSENRCNDCAPDQSPPVDRPTASKSKRVPNPAFMLPLAVSPALAAVVGPGPLRRTEVTQRLWEYIKKNGLQDRKKRTMINADDLLREVFGGRLQVSMFEMTKLVSMHLKKE